MSAGRGPGELETATGLFDDILSNSERLLFFSVFLLLLLPLPGIAQELCPSPAAAVSYDCSTIPEESPTGPWQIIDEYTYDSTWHSDGERLYVEACETSGSAGFYRIEESLAEAEKISLDVRAWVTCNTAVGWLPTVFIGFGVSDGEKIAIVTPQGSLDEGRIGLNVSSDYFASEPGATDWSQPAAYRLVVDKSSEDPAEHVAIVQVNGTTVLTVPYSDLDDLGELPGGVTSPHVFGIGAQHSDTVWEQVEYEICLPQVRPPIEEQIENIKDEADQIDAPRIVRRWIQWRLNRIERMEDPLRQGQAFYRL